MGALVSYFQYRSLDNKKCTVLFVRKKKTSLKKQGKQQITAWLVLTHALSHILWALTAKDSCFKTLFFIAFALNFSLFLLVSCKRISTQPFKEINVHSVVKKRIPHRWLLMALVQK